MPRKSSQGLKTLGLALFLAGGLLLVHMGALPFWLWFALCLVTVFIRLLPRIDPYRDELQLSDQGLVRQHGSRLRRTSTESVRWDEVQRVDVLNEAPGANGRELLFLLYGQGDNGVAVPGSVADRHGLQSVLQARLPGFRDDQLAAAVAASEPTRVTLWEKPGNA